MFLLNLFPQKLANYSIFAEACCMLTIYIQNTETPFANYNEVSLAYQ